MLKREKIELDNQDERKKKNRGFQRIQDYVEKELAALNKIEIENQ